MLRHHRKARVGNSIIRILGRDVDVTTEPDKDLAGYWDSNKGIINVAPGQDAFNSKDTLLHEIMHAILSQQGSMHPYKLEESFVRPLATGLMAVFQDNPQVAKWLVAPIKRKA